MHSSSNDCILHSACGVADPLAVPEESDRTGLGDRWTTSFGNLHLASDAAADEFTVGTYDGYVAYRGHRRATSAVIAVIYPDGWLRRVDSR